MFLDEFAVLLELLVLLPGKLLLTGDFNFHVDDPSDSAALKFLDLLDLFIFDSKSIFLRTKTGTPYTLYLLDQMKNMQLTFLYMT